MPVEGVGLESLNVINTLTPELTSLERLLGPSVENSLEGGSQIPVPNGGRFRVQLVWMDYSAYPLYCKTP